MSDLFRALWKMFLSGSALNPDANNTHALRLALSQARTLEKALRDCRAALQEERARGAAISRQLTLTRRRMIMYRENNRQETSIYPWDPEIAARKRRNCPNRLRKVRFNIPPRVI